MSNEVFVPEGSWFSRFMASGYGRVARVALGAGLIVTGLTAVGGPPGYAVAAFGLVPIAAGVLNLCPVAPLWGGHFLGAKYCGAKVPLQSSSRRTRGDE